MSKTGDSDWNHEAFREYVLRYAAAASLGTPTDIATRAGVSGSMLSKWFRGVERPSVASLQRLATAIHAPLPELMVLAGRASRDQLSLHEVPRAPQPVLVTELARELDGLIDPERSPLTDPERELLIAMVERLVAASRPAQRRRRSA